MRTSARGVALIKSFEGFVSKPYLCPAGVPTIGYGSTFYFSGAAVKLSDRAIDEAEATRILQLTLQKYEDAVARYAQLPLTQNQFDALVSFAYNVGIGNLQKSTLLKKLNTPGALVSVVAAEFDKWVYGNGKRLKGLVNRRAAEKALFLAE